MNIPGNTTVAQATDGQIRSCIVPELAGQ